MTGMMEKSIRIAKLTEAIKECNRCLCDGKDPEDVNVNCTPMIEVLPSEYWRGARCGRLIILAEQERDALCDEAIPREPGPVA